MSPTSAGFIRRKTSIASSASSCSTRRAASSGLMWDSSSASCSARGGARVAARSVSSVAASTADSPGSQSGTDAAPGAGEWTLRPLKSPNKKLLPDLADGCDELGLGRLRSCLIDEALVRRGWAPPPRVARSRPRCYAVSRHRGNEEVSPLEERRIERVLGTNRRRSMSRLCAGTAVSRPRVGHHEGAVVQLVTPYELVPGHVAIVPGAVPATLEGSPVRRQHAE